jgi:MOSC domain-containing protein YiiM
VASAEVGELGIRGDEHDHPAIHGGPERALCLYALERIEALAAEGHPIAPGTTGENVTTRGLDWDQVVPGTRLRLGRDVLIEITRFAPPCKSIRRNFREEDFSRINARLHPGWSRAYARILTGGTIAPGDNVEIVD